MTLVSTPAVLLRSFPYSESSRILRFYTEALGAVGVLARGVRTEGSRGRGALESFSAGTLTLQVKETRELQTLRDFAPTRPRRGLGTDVVRFGAAGFVAELVLKHAGEVANPELFGVLEAALDRLDASPAADVVDVLLVEGWRIVGTLGYRPALETCVQCGAPFAPDEVGRFDFAAGGVRCAQCAPDKGGPRLGPVGRAQLAALADGVRPHELQRPRAHLQILSDFVTWHVAGGQPLNSFQVLWSLLPPEAVPAAAAAGTTPGSA